MILHLAEDSIIIDRIINDFEDVLPGKNTFICFCPGEPKYVKPRDFVYYISEGEKAPNSIIPSSIDKVVIHFLSAPKIEFVYSYISESIPVYWLIWGGDLYNALLTYHGRNMYYEPKYAGKTYLLLNFLSNILGIQYFRNRIGRKTLEFIKERVNYFVSLPCDYDVFDQTFAQYNKGEFKGGFFYYPIDSILSTNKIERRGHSQNIIIGNSGSLSNNHLYAFKYLKRLNLGKRDVILPLSYGGSEKYRHHVIKKGESTWGSNFKPLTTLLPLGEYNEILSSASICIYANWRQEAVGNILSVLCMGSKVFLSKKNPLYDYFRNLSLVVFPLEELDQHLLDTPLTSEQIENNRSVILNTFSKQNLNSSIKSIFG